MQSRACKMLDFSVPIDPPVHGTLPSLTLTLSLSGLRRDPHSALLDTGRLTPSFARGRYFLLADLLLLVLLTIDFAAQSNLAFLGMWITSNGVYQAELLPFDADAGSSSNMVSSQPGRLLGLQSWSERPKNTIRRGSKLPCRRQKAAAIPGV